MGTPLTRNYNTLLTHAMDNIYQKGMFEDLIFKQNPTWAKMKDGGRVFTEDGGAKLSVGLVYEENDTVDSYRGYEEFDVTPQDGHTNAFYDRAQYSGTVSISGIEEHIAGGANKIGDILNDKVSQLVNSFGQRMNKDLLKVDVLADSEPGNGGRDLMAIGAYIQKTPSGAKTVGGIAQATELGGTWQNQSVDGTGVTTSLGLTAKMRKLYNDCAKGGQGFPDLMLCDQTMFENYEAHLDTKVRYTDADSSKASSGFQGIKFKNAELYWDEMMGDPEAGVNYDNTPLESALYAINTKALKLSQAKGKDFAPTPFEWTAKQDARVAAWLWYGQLMAMNRRNLGLIYGVPYSLTIPA
jgi:hypothetical protein